MKVYFNEELVAEVMVNGTMTDNEIACLALGLDDIDDQEALEQLYNNGNPAVYLDDECFYQVDVDAMTTED